MFIFTGTDTSEKSAKINIETQIPLELKIERIYSISPMW